jgi:cyclopropane fatty-acyl-phospholipid synthase-like methyltransferase
MGCAEGLISREFAKAGAKSVLGIDVVEGHIEVAREQCKAFPNMTFEVRDLRKVNIESVERGYDIVLSLGVAHKLKYPGDGIRYAARSGKDLVLVGLTNYGEAKRGVLRSKHYRDNTCNVYDIMREEGFEDFQVLDRSRGETVIYWRKT